MTKPDLAFECRRITATFIDPFGQLVEKPIEIRTHPISGRSCRIAFSRVNEKDVGNEELPDPPPDIGDRGEAFQPADAAMLGIDRHHLAGEAARGQLGEDARAALAAWIDDSYGRVLDIQQALAPAPAARPAELRGSSRGARRA